MVKRQSSGRRASAAALADDTAAARDTPLPASASSTTNGNATSSCSNGSGNGAAPGSGQAPSSTCSDASANGHGHGHGPTIPRAVLRVLEEANAPVLAVSTSCVVTLWNKKVEAITGFDAGGVLGKPLREFVGASRRSSLERHLMKAIHDHKSTLEINLPLKTTTGRNAQVLISLTPLVGDDGVVQGVYGVGQDMTERKIHEKQYARVIMQANAPIIELDKDANITVWNAKTAAITGHASADVIGGPLLGMVDEQFRPIVSANIEHTLRTGIAGADFELPLITSNGSRVEIVLCLTPRFDAAGAVVGVVAIGQDVTERNAKEMEYRKFIDSANAPIFGVDTAGRIVIFNTKAAETSEYRPDEVMGEDLVEKLISEEYRPAVAAVFQKAYEGIETANFEFPLITKAGRKVEILLNATPRYDHMGNLAGVIGIGQDITDRIIQEQEYSRLIDTANAPIFGVDREYRVIIWNKKAATITQYTNEDTMGEKLLKFISVEYRSAVGEVLSKAMDGCETANFEFPLITKSGRRLEILLNATPKYDHCGNICGVVGIGQDISDRRTQEQEYTRLIDTANAPIFGVDKQCRVNIWNRKAAQITEYSVFDVLGANLVEEFIPKEYKYEVGLVLSKALEGIETANFEFPLITRNGRRVEILLNATPRYDEKGAIIGVVGIGQDITVRIAQEQEYSRLIDTANAPIFGVDMKGLINIWNKKAAEITQFTTEEVIGKDLVNRFVSEENRSAVAFALQKALQGAQTANFDFPLITKTGRRVEILLNATPRYNELGNIVGVVGIGQDITERIAQEQEYTRLIDTANAPIFGVDEEGRVNIWNKKAAEITQYTPSDVMGENLVEKFITVDYREAVGYVMSKALNGIETANFEFPLITKAGRRVEILLNATPRFNEHGKVMGMVGIGQDITDRIAQEQEYTRLIDKANAPIFGVDGNGCVNIWNRKAAEITQYSTEEVIGESLVHKFISEDYRDAVATVLAKALEGDESANFEFPLITKSGRRVEILLNATPRFDQQGKIVGVVGIGQDITDRIAQEQEYSRLIDTANAPIFGVDANMCVNIWNKKAAQITNYSIQEVMGENLVETFISPEYRPIVAEVLSKALQGIQTANFEFPLITRPGTRIEILLNATPRHDWNGNIVGVVGIGQDITDRIAQEHEYFRLIDTANAPIFGVDTNGCVNEWNQKIEEITGFHKSSVLGLSLVNTFIIPESRQQVWQLLNQALIGIDVGEMELPMTTKKGCFLLLLVNASSKKDMHGNIRGVIGVGQDYTARKHMEAAKVNFLASFSHELRTPLNGVLGMLELLKEQRLTKQSERYVHMAYVSGSLLLNLINDILDLSKIEAGHMEISAAPFQMQDLLDYSIEIFKFKAREHGLKLEKKCDEGVPQVVIGDVVRLRQVLLNLLSNAIKFTNKGSITVTCSVVHAPDLPKEFNKLLFQVIDTGVGMDPEEKSRLFSLFTKLERTRQNNPTGSGLGLAICKQLVELMDGQIDVDSELGTGSNFFFTVVVRLLDNQGARPNALYATDDLVVSTTAMLTSGIDGGGELVGSNDSNASHASGASSALPLVVVPSKARILVVEDNEFNWEVVKCFLQEDDHMLQWEVNGRDAVGAYVRNHAEYDLVFMDCEMPVMDGYTATGMIRQFEQEHHLPRIPILGLTAYAMSGDRQKCLEAGMDEFIVKPISKVSLIKAIRQWMRVRYVGLKAGDAAAKALPPIITTDINSDTALRSSNTTPTTRTTPRVIERSPSALRDSLDRDSLGQRPVMHSTVVEDELSKEQSSARLAPASRHIQQLDLARAISNLELDDPMAIGRHGGRAFRTPAPSTSIFSLGSSLGTRSTSGNLSNLRRDVDGNAVGLPDWRQISQTSSTMPYMKQPSIFDTSLAEQSTDPASYPKSNPTLWSHPPFKLEPLSTAPLRRKRSADFGEAAQELGGIAELPTPKSPRLSDDRSPSTGHNNIPKGSSLKPCDVPIPEGDPVNYALGVEQCGQEAIFLNLLEKFAQGCNSTMDRITAAYEEGDLSLLRREAHSLKGSSAYAAALRVSKSAFRVQVACDRLLEFQTQINAPSTAALFENQSEEVQILRGWLDDSYLLLKKEHKILRGYLKRNFAFRSQEPSSVHAKEERGDKANPCCVM
ncbi:TPA: hypothetical protein N0F65_006197 [Lagenidium giganteum]|uniref:histidine kinase n=1 Tax=Lagenidium giganteum TaxID=4803 RepID=A0AAV2ZA76_9STRA|nr:TPA: hypothetical protein N0F65_006197 [Lagenidium giganteum]